MKVGGIKMNNQITHAESNNWEGEESGNKDNLVCTYCKIPRHTKDKCWKLLVMWGVHSGMSKLEIRFVK